MCNITLKVHLTEFVLADTKPKTSQCNCSKEHGICAFTA